jgi:DNA-binding Lrp family transcriptional regulator
MSTTKSQRSGLQYPLDELLASPALIRLMRVLVHDVDGPVGVTDAAKMAGLSTVGARKALERLEQAGVAARIGTGRAHKYGLRGGGRYTAMLAQLFEEEQQQYEDLIRRLQLALDIPEVTAAWIERLPLGAAEALQVSVVADTKAIAWIGPELRQRLADTEKRFNLIIEIAVLTRADGPTPPEDALFLRGAGTGGTSGREPGAQTHAESTERSLRMAEATAELIRADPSLIRRALQHTNRLLREGQGTADSDIAEWRHLLETYSPERVRDLLASTSSRAERLRRSSPFFAVLTAEERDRMMQQIEAKP